MKYLFLLFSSLLYAQQSVNPKVNEFIASLSSEVNYFFTENHHPGSISRLRKESIKYDECLKIDYYRSTHLYWKDSENKYWKKSFHICSDDEAVQTDSSIINFAETHFEKIKSEKVLPYEIDRGIKVGDVIRKTIITKDHTPNRTFIFRINSEMDSKNIKLFHLTTEGDNINYEYNQSLKLAELNQMIEE